MRPDVIVTGDNAAVASRGGSRRWTIIGLLFAAVLINYIDRGNLSIVAVPLMHDFGISASRMGTLLSAFFWTYTLLQIPAGYLVDRFGLKWTYAAAFVLWSISSAAVGLAGSFAQVLIFRLLLGVGEAAVQPASLAFIRRNFPPAEQGLPTAVYLSGMSFGPAIGAIIGSTLLASVGWRLVFITTGLGACVWLLPWLLMVRRDQVRHEKTVVRYSGDMSAQILRGRTLWGIVIGAFFYSYFWYYCLTWLPSYLVMGRGFSFLKMGVFTAAPFLTTALMSMVAGRAADRLIAKSGRPIAVRKGFVVCGFCLGSSILLLLFLKSAGAVLATLMLSLMGIGLASANYWALTQAASPAALVGRVIGFQNTIANLAGIFSPIVTGILIDKTKSFEISITCAGLSLLVAAAAFFFLVRQQDVDRLNTLCAVQTSQ
jgi:MFS family permease